MIRFDRDNPSSPGDLIIILFYENNDFNKNFEINSSQQLYTTIYFFIFNKK